MAILSPTNLETADYGQSGWNAIYSSNFEKLNNYLSKFQILWNPSSGDDNKLIKYNNSAGEWEATSFTASQVQNAIDRTANMDHATTQTTDDTPTTLWSKTLDEGKAYLVEAKIVGKNGDSARNAYIRRALVYRPSGGSATMEGSVQDELTIESDVDWDATIDVDGNDVRVRVTGKASTTIDWACDVSWVEV